MRSFMHVHDSVHERPNHTQYTCAVAFKSTGLYTNGFWWTLMNQLMGVMDVGGCPRASMKDSWMLIDVHEHSWASMSVHERTRFVGVQ